MIIHSVSRILLFEARIELFEARIDNSTACEKLLRTLRNGGIGLVVDIFTGRTLDKEVNDDREDTRQAET